MAKEIKSVVFTYLDGSKETFEYEDGITVTNTHPSMVVVTDPEGYSPRETHVVNLAAVRSFIFDCRDSRTDMRINY